MFELAVAGFLGVLALPWYILGIFIVVLLVDVGASSKEEFAVATTAVILGLLLVSGLGWWTGGLNPIAWAWNNPVDLITGFVGYVLVGCLWSVVKWKLFLRKLRKKTEKSNARTKNVTKVRPHDSYVSENAGRLTGWIFHWPFSMLGVIVGDVIIRFADTCYKALSGLFERMARSEFDGYEER